MSFNLKIGGSTFHLTDFNVVEAATPLAAGDSSGQTGTINLTIPARDEYLNPNHPVTMYGVPWFVGKSIYLEDTRKGFTLGRVSSVRGDFTSGTVSLTCTSRLGELNVYNVQAMPFVGTLQDAFDKYVELAGITTDVYVDPEIATEPVVFPGWHGELWVHLKQMAAAMDCDVSLVSGIILLRPIRKREAVRGRDLARNVEVGGGNLAQSIIVNQYNNRPINNELVYPPGGWSQDVSTINVNSGESVEEVLELSASVSSIAQPTMQTFVSHTHRSSSVFTVVGDDGLPIQPAQWTAAGGRLRIEINPDTTSLTAYITAPTGIRNKDNKEIGVYGIALSSESNTGRYSTLRIVGTGVEFNVEEVRVPTGVGPRETATEIGATIDNPFLSTRDQVYTAGVRAAREYSGTSLSVTGTVTAINQRGETGEITLRSYAEFQTAYGSGTYASVQALFAGQTYAAVQDAFNAGELDLFENQVFGNGAGARVWDQATRRWYRIRQVTLGPATIQFDAEDDLLHRDVQRHLNGLTYAGVQLLYNGFSYRDVDLMGLRPDREVTVVHPLYPSGSVYPSTSLFPRDP